MIIACRIISYNVDSKVRGFLNDLNKAVNKPISKVAYYLTHSWSWKNSFLKSFEKALREMACIKEICPKFLRITVIKNKGPLVEGSDVKISEYISTLRDFMK